jgi:inner membrane protein
MGRRRLPNGDCRSPLLQMNTEAHLAVGWILAHCGGGESRRFRGRVVLAALAPDLDAISYVGGPDLYARLHHAVGHNVFFSLFLSGFCMALDRQRPWKMLLFTQLAFYSHFLGDYFFTRFPLEFFWPVSSKGYIYSYRIGLDHWLNDVFGYASFLVFGLTGIRWGRTPIELLWPRLDQRVVNLFRRRTLRCTQCGRGATERCSVCHEPVCLRHGRITARCDVLCGACAAAGKPPPATRAPELAGKAEPVRDSR